jgi:hypothetical protein
MTHKSGDLPNEENDITFGGKGLTLNLKPISGIGFFVLKPLSNKGEITMRR